MLRPLVYALIIYFVLLAMMAYGLVDHFVYWLGICGTAAAFGAVMGTLFGAVHMREQHDEY
ncbi:MAG: hypothetical protein ACU843_04420 [Gammaproteobacteria bacterium]